MEGWKAGSSLSCCLLLLLLPLAACSRETKLPRHSAALVPCLPSATPPVKLDRNMQLSLAVLLPCAGAPSSSFTFPLLQTQDSRIEAGSRHSTRLDVLDPLVSRHLEVSGLPNAVAIEAGRPAQLRGSPSPPPKQRDGSSGAPMTQRPTRTSRPLEPESLLA